MSKVVGTPAQLANAAEAAGAVATATSDKVAAVTAAEIRATDLRIQRDICVLPRRTIVVPVLISELERRACSVGTYPEIRTRAHTMLPTIPTISMHPFAVSKSLHSNRDELELMWLV